MSSAIWGDKYRSAFEDGGRRTNQGGSYSRLKPKVRLNRLLHGRHRAQHRAGSH